MNVKDFNDKYKAEHGGIMMLTEMRALLFPLDNIGSYFGVSKERVRQWMEEFFVTPYDPRPGRREAIIGSMLDFARKNPTEEFTKAYTGTEYYSEAYDRAVELEIYEKG